MSSDLDGIGARMREVRNSHDFSQSKVAARLNIADRTYKFYELEKREIPLSVALRFCDEFSIELKWLATGSGPKEALGNFAIYERAAEATLSALEAKGIKVPPGVAAKQISYVLDQSNAKGSSPVEEAEALVSILAISGGKND